VPADLIGIGKLLVDGFNALRAVVRDRGRADLIHPRMLLRMHGRVSEFRECLYDLALVLESKSELGVVAGKQQEAQEAMDNLLRTMHAINQPLLQVYAPELARGFDFADLRDNEVRMAALLTPAASLILAVGAYDQELYARTYKVVGLPPLPSSLGNPEIIGQITALNATLGDLNEQLAAFMRANWSPKDLT